MNVDLFVKTLPMMVEGMGGVFLATIVIMLSITGLNKIK